MTYRVQWKIDRGHYDPATCAPYSDERCDWIEGVLRERALEEREWTPAYFRRLFGIRTASSRQGRMGVDKEVTRERADVLRLLAARGIDHRVTGGNAVFKCPFHPDGKPSASFSLKKKMWFCYPEGIGGDLFDFVMRLDGVSFGEAVEVIHRLS